MKKQKKLGLARRNPFHDGTRSRGGNDNKETRRWCTKEDMPPDKHAKGGGRDRTGARGEAKQKPGPM